MSGPALSVEVPAPSYFQRQVSCREACPVHTDSGGYVRAIAEGRYEDAYIIARTPNPFASVCGRVCNAPCEMHCRRGAIDSPVAIRALKRFVSERFGVESGRFDLDRIFGGRSAIAANASRVAVIGAGPAGMACAHDLALAGISVTVFEAQPIAGGMLVLGVPAYRLPREVIQAEIQAVLDLGVELRLGQRLGHDFALADLRQQGYQAVFIGIGAHRSRELNIEGVELDGVFRAIDFLLNVNLGYRVELGKKVVVIGGGNVAFDAARSVIRQIDRAEALSPEELRAALQSAREALRQLTEREPEVPEDLHIALDAARQALRKGAPEVHVYCLEDLSEIPAAREEIDEALGEGIKLHPRWGPRRVVGRNGSVTGIELIRVSRVFDENRRFNPTFVEGSEEVIEADTVILAIGQAADLSWIRPEDNLRVTPRGAIETDRETLATSRPDVFAGGDVAFGPRIIIDAVAEGRRAARSIAAYLGVQPAAPSQTVRVTRFLPYRPPAGYERLRRELPPMLPISRRVGVSEVETIYPEAAARPQAVRCLHCHVAPVFDGDTCILCGGCVDICPEYCLRIVDSADLRGDAALAAALRARYGGVPVRGAGAAIIKDETRCIRCGLCAVRCPTGAITMERVEVLAA
ncbi:MAG: FAD-dependent oxidoreductase [Deltaproteobacteria bacterium]|nr:FAD-dependent oxidoreductase [Deltaproteobacteria bacterium]